MNKHLTSFSVNWLRVFTSRILKNLAFSISKSHFITFNIPLYNTFKIKTSIFFLQFHLNIIFYSFFVFIFFILSPSLPLGLTVSLLLDLTVSTQQSYPPLATNHHNSKDHHNDQRPMPIKSMTHADETNQVDDPRQLTRRSVLVMSMIHERRPTNLDPQT